MRCPLELVTCSGTKNVTQTNHVWRDAQSGVKLPLSHYTGLLQQILQVNGTSYTLTIIKYFAADIFPSGEDQGVFVWDLKEECGGKL